MNLSDQYAKFLHDASWYKHVNEGNAKELSYLVLGLVGESGEFADALKKIVRRCGFDDIEAFKDELRDPEVRVGLVAELGDVMWYHVKLMSFLHIGVEELMVCNTYKLYSRLNERGPDWPQAPAKMDWPLIQVSVHDAYEIKQAVEMRGTRYE